jgi:hypothetical protein
VVYRLDNPLWLFLGGERCELEENRGEQRVQEEKGERSGEAQQRKDGSGGMSPL